MNRAIDRLKSRIKPDSVVMLFFGGLWRPGRQRELHDPVDAAIWRESDVRRQGFSVESVLDVMKQQGARAKLVVIDASRRKSVRAALPRLLPRPRPDRCARQTR